MPRHFFVTLFSVLLIISGHAQATSLSAPMIAGNTTDIIWISATNLAGVVSGLGTSDITLDGSPNALTLAVVQTMSPDDGLGGIFGALAFDQDLGDELNGPGFLAEVNVNNLAEIETPCAEDPACLPLPEFPFFLPSTETRGYHDELISPTTRDSSLGTTSGYALGLDAIKAVVGLTQGPMNITFTAFTVTFTVNEANLASDGFDVFYGAFGTPIDYGAGPLNFSGVVTDGGGIIYDATISPWAGASVNLVPEPATLALLALGLAALTVGRRRRS